ncbi:unnamed protein product [Sphagnum jensenii]|uniref:Uncharacterized protein n=1 Tax=Sphagnum jensenii TaxID=128206 RepID=A0ABP1C3N4_9BRYO
MPASRRTTAVDDQIDTRDTSFLYISKTKSTGTSWGFVEIGRITHSSTSAFVVATSLNQFRQHWLASSARAWIGKNVKMQQADAGMPLLRRWLIHLMDPCTCANTTLQVAAFGELKSAAIRMLAITLVIQASITKYGTEAVPEPLITSLLEMVQPLLTSREDILVDVIRSCCTPDTAHYRWCSLVKGAVHCGWAAGCSPKRIPRLIRISKSHVSSLVKRRATEGLTSGKSRAPRQNDWAGG